MRPDWDTYFMQMTDLVATRSSCIRRQVGAVIVDPFTHAIVSTGYNGTPAGTPNCNEGGCKRCNSTAPLGANYGICRCVHAEENAIALAARNGWATDVTTLYSTYSPCFTCLRMAVQAGITVIHYRILTPYPPEEAAEFQLFAVDTGIELHAHDEENYEHKRA